MKISLPLDCECVITILGWKKGAFHGKIKACPKHKVEGLKMNFAVKFTTPLDVPKPSKEDMVDLSLTCYHGVKRVFCSICNPPKETRSFTQSPWLKRFRKE